MKILVSAYGCEPYKGSESGVGWNWVKRMAIKHELWVITRANNQSQISLCKEEWVHSVHWIYYDLPPFIRKLKRGDKGLYFYYFLWQLSILKKAKRLQAEISFDCVWHLSFGSMWMPTFLYKLPIPFIWGPIGGGESIPRSYWPLLTKKNAFTQWIRQIMIKTAMLNPFFAIPAKRATVILVRTEDSRKVFPSKMNTKIFTSLETCMEEDTLLRYQKKETAIHNKQPLRCIYTGRLIPLKALEITIRAIAKMKHKEQITFTIVGKGALKKPLADLCKELGVGRQVHFVEYMPREELLAILEKQDLFVFPSLKEGGSWALMEAMAVGLAPICHDLSGMHLITSEGSAWRVKADGIEKSIHQFAEVMDYCVEHPQEVAEKGKAAHERIACEFVWQSKDAVIEDVLTRVRIRKCEQV